jgi:hypothetical protein
MFSCVKKPPVDENQTPANPALLAAEKVSHTFQVAEKFKKCHSEGAVCPRNLFFISGLAEKADPSLRSG